MVRKRIRGIERRHAERVRVLEEQRRADERVSSLRLQLEHDLARYLERPAELEQILRDIVADGLRASEVVQGLRGFLSADTPPGGGLRMTPRLPPEAGRVERTVKLHRAKAMSKLRARSTADLVRIAERLGLSGGEDL